MIKKSNFNKNIKLNKIYINSRGGYQWIVVKLTKIY